MIGLLLLALSLMLSSPSYAQSLPGDINGDGHVDEADLDRGTEIALGRLPAALEQELKAGDLDRDGRVTVRDLVLIANAIGGQNRPPVADASASPDSGSMGVDIHLNGEKSLDLDGDSLRVLWQQVHMNRYDEVYATEHQAVLSNATSMSPIFQAPGSGKYRFALTVTDDFGLTDVDTVDVWVRPQQTMVLDVTGTIMGDIFGEYGGPTFDILPDNTDSATAVLDRAVEASVRVGAGWVGVVPSAWYAQISPTPVIAPGPNDLGLTEERDYAAIVQAIRTRGLKAIHEEQVSVGILPLRPGEADSLGILADSSTEWWDAWFTEFQTYIVKRAQWAEKYGVGMLILFNNTDFTLRPAVYPQYDERWREVIQAVRAVYSGKIAVNMFFTDRLTFADALDVLCISISPGQYTSFGAFSDNQNPTLEELVARTKEIFDEHEQTVGGKIPVYIIFNATSADGQDAPEPPLPPIARDYREQVLYYEAFFHALQDEPWITGVLSERWAWFDEPDYPGVFFDQIITTSPRNKPAEEVIRFWFGLK